ncbi:DUF4181 domain-containing protein [Evansella cellulosilytica]|uniref:DUF4181 domain-containing protein n=1 Tax=Evansella cellulosilytica TaxID=1413 RepID=UPI0012F6FB19|nr:DUF4181 domain-containing protein [Evansella cellulosilytica]
MKTINWIELIVVSVIIFGIQLAVIKLLKRKFDIKNYGLSYKHINSVQAWIERGLFIVFIILLFFAYSSLFVWFSFILVLFIFRAYLEWKYARSDKQYILILCYLFFLLIFLSIVYLFF